MKVLKLLMVVSVASVVVLMTGSFLKAQELKKKLEITSLKDVDEDYAIQGEYIGKRDLNGNPAKLGLQIVAEGNGDFKVVFFPTGLPGDGYSPGDRLYYAKGETTSDGEVILTYDPEPDYQLDVKDGKVLFGTRALFERVERTSPTLGAAPPEGAVVIFDGKNTDMFEPGAKMNDEEKTLWSEAVTKPLEDKPYTLHVEFMHSYMPYARGQARSNSGVYVADCYECQVLDSFGNPPANNESGGFYTVATPLVNMCYPPLQWQTYDFDFTPVKYEDGKKVEPARVTVKHNGVVIHDDIELRETPGRQKEGAGPRPIYLQGHGNKVQYRNIWVLYK